jgi:beta-phosphoglucomutase-like phosphatase (HAD superfamily)
MVAVVPEKRRTRRRQGSLSPPLDRRDRARAVLDLDAAAARWQLAIDSAQRASDLAAGPLIHARRRTDRRAFTEERLSVASELTQLAHLHGIRPAPWLPSIAVTGRMLGLPVTARACIFDLDDVLTDSAVLHAYAWADVFDDLLLRLAEKTRWQFIPFNRDTDYRASLDGKPRLEGVQAFLGSRGIRLPEGRPDDPPTVETMNGLANHKTEALESRMRDRGVVALAGARRYLEAAGHADLRRAVVSASATTVPMLERAGLANLVEARVDAAIVRSEQLRSRPAPDVLLAACRRLEVDPQNAVTFTHNAEVAVAARTAGLSVVGVAMGNEAAILTACGAQRVVGRLDQLLDRRLAQSTAQS